MPEHKSTENDMAVIDRSKTYGSGNISRSCLGLLTRKPRWGLSGRGWLVLMICTGGITIEMLLQIQPFLAVSQPVNAEVLVVEGWVREYCVRAGAKEFKTGSYQRVFTTGGPVIGNGGYINDYNTSASVGADLVKKAGVPAEFVQMVPSRIIDRDRTYGAALALHDWFRVNNVKVHSINVVTEDAHARRTRLLFQKAFGEDVEVGIISVPNPDYDARRWWRYSEGVRDVISEGIAYFYARFLFSPP